MRSNNLEKERMGKINKNTNGSLMEIIKYNNSNDILVRFEKGNLVNTEWSKFLKGQVRNVFDITVYDVGYLGEGQYKSRDKHGKHTPQYAVWSGMLQRCYSEKQQIKQPTYKDCYVVKEWHNFQTFASWFDQNYYKIDGMRMHLDKDILIKGNKIYSPETCVFAPQIINTLFVKNDVKRGELPLGVSWNRNTQNYEVHCHSSNGKHDFLGKYNDPYDAFNAYKTYKEKIIKRIAEEYKNKIPVNLYEAMIKYQVEITD